MTTAPRAPSASRSKGPRRAGPLERGQPDPRPLTQYTVALTTPHGHDRLTVTLAQPCVIRAPLWPVVDCADGSLVYPVGVSVDDNTTFHLDFAGVLSTMAALVQVPYQDMQVQNFQGGFVRPGGQWFRKPT